MKKLTVIFIAFVFLISCKDMKRVNPTDPQASNYTGMHYTGSISGLSEVADFDAYGGNIYVADKIAGKVYCFNKNGDQEWETPQDSIVSPSAVYADYGKVYIYDSNDGVVSRITVGNSNISSFDVLDFNVHEFIVDENENFYFALESGIYKKCTLPAGSFGTAQPVALTSTADDWFMQVSDMCFNGTNEIVAADSELYRILFMDLNGNFRMKIEPGTDIKGIAVKDGILYVPCAAGIIEYSCVNGSKLRVWADYGEGNGKVIKPSLIDTMDSAVYVENVSDIKVFEP